MRKTAVLGKRGTSLISGSSALASLIKAINQPQLSRIRHPALAPACPPFQFFSPHFLSVLAHGCQAPVYLVSPLLPTEFSVERRKCKGPVLFLKRPRLSRVTFHRFVRRLGVLIRNLYCLSLKCHGEHDPGQRGQLAWHLRSHRVRTSDKPARPRRLTLVRRCRSIA